jgi:uncharacterized protein (TIGR02145 family)
MLAALLASACSDDGDNAGRAPEIAPDATGTFTDSRNDVEYGWVRYGDLDWMTSNMQYATVEGAYSIYDNAPNVALSSDKMVEYNAALLTKYGYLYDYTAACTACPDGWRLPSDDDWQSLEMVLGMSASDVGRTEWRGDFAGELMMNDGVGTYLAITPGGYNNYLMGESLSYNYRQLGVYGFYWTATMAESVTENAYYRKLYYDSPQVFRYYMEIYNQLSVRCVRDAA